MLSNRLTWSKAGTMVMAFETQDWTRGHSFFSQEGFMLLFIFSALEPCLCLLQKAESVLSGKFRLV